MNTGGGCRDWKDACHDAGRARVTAHHPIGRGSRPPGQLGVGLGRRGYPEPELTAAAGSAGVPIARRPQGSATVCTPPGRSPRRQQGRDPSGPVERFEEMRCLVRRDPDSLRSSTRTVSASPSKSAQISIGVELALYFSALLNRFSKTSSTHSRDGGDGASGTA